MDLKGLVLYLFAVFLLGITPGQAVAALLNMVVGQGRKAAIAFNLGISSGDIFWLGLAIYGLKMVDFLVPFLRYAGVIYLLYMAYDMWKNAAIFGEELPTRTHMHSAFGLLLTLSNPKVMIFYLSLVPSFLPLETVTFGQYILVASLTCCVIFSVNMFYILLAERLITFIKNKEKLIKIRRANALTLVALAGLVLVQGT